MSETNVDHPEFSSQLMETLKQNPEGVLLLSVLPPIHHEIHNEMSGCMHLRGCLERQGASLTCGTSVPSHRLPLPPWQCLGFVPARWM